MLRITELKLPVTEPQESLWPLVARRLGLAVSAIRSLSIERCALDARKKPELFFVYTVVVALQEGSFRLDRRLPGGVSQYKKETYRFPYRAPERLSDRPVVVGSGPAGLFCAYELAKAGFAPILLERGDPVEIRQQKVRHFWETGDLDPASNLQFGEGGAGTFSDGKLYTGNKDRSGRIREVLQIFVDAGAPEEILYQAHAHLGTDTLIDYIRQIREEIERLGGSVYFRQTMNALELRHGQIHAVKTAEGMTIPTSHVVLAIGHSARDTFRYLHRAGVPMEAKPFAFGLRIQHPQEWITRAQYGENAPLELGAAAYRLHTTSVDGRAVFSFCMCPGGYVVNASSEPERLVVNGMSEQARDSGYANSAIVTAFRPEECGFLRIEHEDDCFLGMRAQELLEERAYSLADGAIPYQTFGSLQKQEMQSPMREIAGCKGRTAPAPLGDLLPQGAKEALIEAICRWDRSIPGFAAEEVPLFGIESRTSSPVRILRGQDLQSNVPGLFPCGEGAGYAGGITSAAADGIHVAEQVAERIVRGSVGAYTVH